MTTKRSKSATDLSLASGATTRSEITSKNGRGVVVLDAPKAVHTQTHEYELVAIDSRDGDDRQMQSIDGYSARGWRLIAVMPDGAMRTLYFERAVKP